MSARAHALLPILGGPQALATVPVLGRGPSLEKRLAPVQGLDANTLRIHEIYASVQGEGSHVGLPCTLVRLTGCHLRCSYCDTPHAFREGALASVKQVLQKVANLGPKLVLVTGGEPLLQAAAWPLMARLCDAGYGVLLETSGAIATDSVDARVHRIVDLKAPSSGEEANNYYAGLTSLRRHDEVKFVLGDRADYAWARACIDEHGLSERCQVLLGAVWGKLEPRILAEWMLEDRLCARLQVQLHKYLWDAEARGV